MIVLHQDHVGAFGGGHTVYWVGQPLYQQVVASPGAAIASVIVSRRHRMNAIRHSGFVTSLLLLLWRAYGHI